MLAGLVLLAHSRYLGLTHQGLLGRDLLASLVPGPQFLFGPVLVRVGIPGLVLVVLESAVGRSDRLPVG
ncbi:hypothetical protein ACKVMT_14650 [Halobacteriales archaeon Cl-PHB]